MEETCQEVSGPATMVRAECGPNAPKGALEVALRFWLPVWCGPAAMLGGGEWCLLGTIELWWFAQKSKIGLK